MVALSTAAPSPRRSPLSSSFFSFGAKVGTARNVAIFMDGQGSSAADSGVAGPPWPDGCNGGDGGGIASSPCAFSCRRTLLAAVLKNDADQVRTVLQQGLEYGLDPNFAICMGLLNGSRGGGRTNEEEAAAAAGWSGPRIDDAEMTPMRGFCMDRVFLFKRVLGDSPSLLHIAILNVYHRTKHCASSRYLVRQYSRAEVEKALAIFRLLLEYGANVHQPSPHPTLDCGVVADRAGGANTPLDLAERMHRIAFLDDTTHAATASSRWGSSNNNNGGGISLQTTMLEIVEQCKVADECRKRDSRQTQQEEQRGDKTTQAADGVEDGECQENDGPHDGCCSRSQAAEEQRADNIREMDMVVLLDDLSHLHDLIFVHRKMGTPTSASSSPESHYEALTLFCSDGTA